MKIKKKYLVLLTQLLLLFSLLLEMKHLMLVIQSKLTITQKLLKSKTKQLMIKLTSEDFTARLKQANLASKNDIANFVKKDKF